MHEMGVAAEAYRICRERIAPGAPLRLTRVRLAVGELSTVEPELLRFAWTALTEGGADADCELVIDWCPAVQTCSACGEVAERASGSWMKICPRCGLPLRVEGGQELDVVSVETGPVTPASVTNEGNA